MTRHFSYYALDGGSGALRWKHEVWPRPGNIHIFQEVTIIFKGSLTRPAQSYRTVTPATPVY